MIPRDAEPIGHIPPLPRIDLNPPPRPIAQVPMPIYNPFMEAVAQDKRKAEQDRIWKVIEQTSEGACPRNPPKRKPAGAFTSAGISNHHVALRGTRPR